MTVMAVEGGLEGWLSVWVNKEIMDLKTMGSNKAGRVKGQEEGRRRKGRRRRKAKKRKKEEEEDEEEGEE